MRLAVVLLASVVVGCSSASSTGPSAERDVFFPDPPSEQPVTTGFPGPTAQIAGVEVYELPSYIKAGRGWRNFVVPLSIGRDELVRLATELHKSGPETSYRFFTDAREYRQYAAWDQNYPDDAYPYTEQWARKHYIAMVNKMFAAGAAHWELQAMDAGMRYVDPATGSVTLAMLD
jgi:hypothetical protein